MTEPTKSDERVYQISRRRALQGGATLAVAGGVGAFALSGSAAAVESSGIDLDDAEAETTQGEVAFLATGLQGFVEWENFSDEVESIAIRDKLRYQSEDEAVEINSATTSDAFGRDQDTAAFGNDGHVTWHIPNPDGSMQEWSNAEEGEWLDAGSEAPTWIIASDDDLLEEMDEDDLPYAVDPEYGLPENPRGTGEFPVPGDGETAEIDIEYTKEIDLRDGGAEVLHEEVIQEVFTLSIENLDGEVIAYTEGLTDAGGP